MLGSVMSAMGFSLAGGTALALYFGHRRSVDLDWFTQKSIGDVLTLAGDLQQRGVPLVVRRTAHGTLHGSVLSVHTLMFEYPYPLLKPALRLKPFGCQVASLDDIACMKLSAVAQRGSKKDFVDIVMLLQHRASLRRLLTLYSRKYSISDTLHVLNALVYFDDAEREPMPRMLRDLDWRTVKRRLRLAVADLAG